MLTRHKTDLMCVDHPKRSIDLISRPRSTFTSAKNQQTHRKFIYKISVAVLLLLLFFINITNTYSQIAYIKYEYNHSITYKCNAIIAY